MCIFRGVEKVLARDHFTLEELLDQEEVVQEVRGYNESLLVLWVVRFLVLLLASIAP